jgi:hypothetical protein
MKNFRSITFCFNYSQWLTNDHVYGTMPIRIKEWADRLYPHRYRFDSEWHDNGFHIIFTNVPKSFATWAVLSTHSISVVEQVEFAPIHPDVLPLFDFGDDE